MKKTLAIFVLFFFINLTSKGAIRTASVSGNFNNTATWGGASIPVNGDDIVINTGITVTLQVDFITTGTFTMNGTATLQMNGFNFNVGNLSALGSATINNAGVASAFNCGINNTSTSYSGGISGNIQFIKSGTGTQVLSGANTYTGNTTINGGTLQVANAAALGSAAAGTQVNTGGTFDINGYSLGEEAFILNGGTILNNGASQFSAFQKLTVTANSFIGGTNRWDIRKGSLGAGSNVTINAGITLTKQDGNGIYFAGMPILNNGSIIANGGLFFLVEGATTSGTGTYTVGGSGQMGLESHGLPVTLTNNVIINGGWFSTYNNTGGNCVISGNITLTGTATFNLPFDFNITGNISGSGNVAKRGGGILNVSGASTYSGTTDIIEGTWRVGATNTIPDGSAVTVTGTLDMNGFSETVGSIAGTGTINNLSGTGTYTLTAGGNNTTNTYSGVIQNTTGAVSFVKNGTGTQVLSGANTYTGSTIINGGTLQVANAAALGSAAAGTQVNTGGTFDINGYSLGEEAFILNGGSIINNGAVQIQAMQKLTVIANSVIGGTTRWDVRNNGLASAGVTINSGVVLTKQGNESTFFVAVPVVNNGSMVINSGVHRLENGCVTSGTGGYTVNTSGTLSLIAFGAGVNLTNSVTVNGGSINSFNNTGGNSMISGNVTITGAATIDNSVAFDISGVISGTGSLTKIGAGTLTLTGASTYSGITTLNAGIVSIAGGGSLYNLGSAAGSIVVNNSATLLLSRQDFMGVHTTTPTATVTINEGGVVSSNNYFNTLNNLTLAGGQLQSNGGNNPWESFALKGTVTVNGTTVSSIISPSGTFNKVKVGTNANGGTTIFDVLNNVTGDDLIISSVLENNKDASANFVTSRLQKTGAGTLNLSGANEFSGGYIHINGDVKVSNNTALGTGTAVMNGVGRIILQNGVSVNTPLTVTTSSPGVGYGSITLLTGSATYAGNIAINANTGNGGHLSSYGTNLTISGTITGASGISVSHRFGNITYSGGGTASNFLLIQGNAKLAANNGLPSNANFYQNHPGFTTSFDLFNFNQTFSSIESIITAGSHTITNSQADIRSLTLNGVQGNNTTYNGAITGNIQLVKSGATTQTLAGTNTYSGGTTISGGVLQLGNNGTTGSITGNITNNATFAYNRTDTYTYEGVISGTGDLHVKQGTLILTGTNTFTGTITIDPGATLQIGNSGTIGQVASANIINNGTLIFNRSNTITYGGVISGTGVLTKNGVGILTLTGTNTFTGNTTVNAGTLQAGNGSALGATGMGTQINSSATFDINEFNLGSEEFTLNGGTIVNNGATISTAIQKLTVTANSFIGGVGRWDVRNSGLVGGGVTVNAGVTLTKQDANEIRFFNYPVVNNGEIIVNGGNLFLENGNGLITSGSGTYTVNASGALGLEAWSGVAGITLTNNVTVNNGTLVSKSANFGSSNISGNVVVTGTATIDNSVNFEISGIISGGAITKISNGTLTLSGTNTYSGATTISAGTLKLGAAGVIPDGSAVTVAGTLEMNGFSETVGSIAGAGTVDNTSGTGTYTLTCGGDNTGTTFSGIIQNTAGTVALFKEGNGTLVLSGNNTFTGNITFPSGSNTTGGIIHFTNSNAAGVGPKDITMPGTNNTLQRILLSGGITISGATINTAGRNNGQQVFLQNVSGSNEWAAAIQATAPISGEYHIENLAGTLTISGNMNKTITSNIDYTFKGNGNYVVSGIISENGTAGVVTLTKSGTGSITLSGANTHKGYVLINAGTLRLNNTSALGAVSDSTVINNGASIDLNGITYSLAEKLNVRGNGDAGAGVIYNGSATAATYAGSIKLGADSRFTTGNQITLSGTVSGATFNLTKEGANSLVFTNNTVTVNDFTISTGLVNAGSSTINIGGNLTISSTFNENIGEVAFVGSTPQTVPNHTFYDVRINNASGVGLTANTTIGGTVFMTSGILTTGAFNINLGSGGNIDETTPNAQAPTSYITGSVTTTRDLIQGVANSFGGIGLTLTENNIASNSTVVTRVTGTVSSIPSGQSSIARYFDITPAVDTALDATMEFSYFNHEITGHLEDSLIVYKSSDNRATWDGFRPTALDLATNTLTLSSIQDFSSWTLSDIQNEPLPIRLLDFKVKATEDNQVVLNWTTVKEENNAYFTIERSINGKDWVFVEEIDGAGTTNQKISYKTMDKDPFQGISYYRLKQTDYDGKFEYFNIVPVEINYKAVNSFECSIYPSPSRVDNMNMLISSEDLGLYQVNIINGLGNVLYSTQINHQEASEFVDISNSIDNYNFGTYYIIVVNDKNSICRQKIIFE